MSDKELAIWLADRAGLRLSAAKILEPRSQSAKSG